MLILTIRTDKPEAELGLFDGEKELAYLSWHAHRELSNTIHQKIDELLAPRKKTLQDLQGVVAFQGPGSFTGLRIGLTVANTLAYGLGGSIKAAQGENWVQDGIHALENGEADQLAMPEYGAEAHITKQKK